MMLQAAEPGAVQQAANQAATGEGQKTAVLYVTYR